MAENDVRIKDSGQTLSATEWNALVRLAKHGLKIMTAAPLEVKQLPGGQLLTLSKSGVEDMIGESALTIQAQTFYSDAANASAQQITSSGSYVTITLDSYTGDNFISLASDVMTTTTAGTYWVGFTPAWALGNSSISAGDNYAYISNIVEKYNGSTWDAVAHSQNYSHVWPATAITSVNTSTGVPDGWQSINMAWKAGSSFPIVASANDQYRVRAAVIGFTYSRTSPGTKKVVTITGNSGGDVLPYQISWYLPSIA